uniref:Uncharacterized protein n=1 Tax=Romanomermis culicivorax TaxID=13658 RepID=A0A915KBQ2_ROMCU
MEIYKILFTMKASHIKKHIAESTNLQYRKEEFENEQGDSIQKASAHLHIDIIVIQHIFKEHGSILLPSMAYKNTISTDA